MQNDISHTRKQRAPELRVTAWADQLPANSRDIKHQIYWLTNEFNYSLGMTSITLCITTASISGTRHNCVLTRHHCVCLLPVFGWRTICVCLAGKRLNIACPRHAYCIYFRIMRRHIVCSLNWMCLWRKLIFTVLYLNDIIYSTLQRIVCCKCGNC